MRNNKYKEESIVGGVFSTISNKYGIDVLLLRFIGVILLLSYDDFFWIYIILAIIISLSERK